MDSKKEATIALVIFGILVPPVGVVMLGAFLMGGMLSLFAIAATQVLKAFKSNSWPVRTEVRYVQQPQLPARPQFDLSLLDPLEREALEERRKRRAQSGRS
jgi:hypothetical protein